MLDNQTNSKSDTSSNIWQTIECKNWPTTVKSIPIFFFFYQLENEEKDQLFFFFFLIYTNN